jgi:hypothetical protein
MCNKRWYADSALSQHDFQASPSGYHHSSETLKADPTVGGACSMCWERALSCDVQQDWCAESALTQKGIAG